MIFIKSPKEIAIMRDAGRMVSEVLSEVEKLIQPGITTADLDAYAEKLIRGYGAKPTFKGYRYPESNAPPFPATLCTSINEEIIHGIPSKKRRLKEGDIIGVDCGVTYLGLIADAASTFMVGCVDPRVEKLVRITREALQKAIASIKCYGHVHDISSEIQNHAESNGFSVVRDFCGHGVGKSMHEGPAVPNCGRKGTGTRLEPNMTIAIEPMINMGTHAVKMLSDSWTIVTADGKPSAHFEHSVVITEYGAEILTKK